jgi:hypothetical protein
MSFELKIIPEAKLVIEQITGELTLQLMIEKTLQLFADPNYDISYSGVVDLRTACTQISKVELLGFANLINDSEHFGHSPWAILADNPLLVALSQIFQQRLKDPNTIGIFVTVTEAAKFIGNLELLEYLHD